MKVLFVSSGNTTLGISTPVRIQGESLKKNGVDVNFYTIKGKGLGGYIKNVYGLRNKLRSNGFQLIHAHYGLSGIVAILASRGKKVIVSFMGSDLMGITKEGGKKPIYNKGLLLLHRLFAKYLHACCIVKSNSLKRYLKNDNAVVIPNGIDFEIFYPLDLENTRRKLNLPLNNKIILFAADPGRVEKNFKLAADAVTLVKHAGTVLLPVYDKNQMELNDYYNAADVLLLTSLNEGSPNVIKEAMACNLPIVSTDVGDVREITDETAGCYVTSFDPTDIARCIEHALAFGRRTEGAAKVRHLEINKVALRIISLYERVLQENGNAGF